VETLFNRPKEGGRETGRLRIHLDQGQPFSKPQQRKGGRTDKGVHVFPRREVQVSKHPENETLVEKMKAGRRANDNAEGESRQAAETIREADGKCGLIRKKQRKKKNQKEGSEKSVFGRDS